MMSSNHILEVTEADFEYEVLAHSENVPVIVDFWAEWCGPCKVLGPILERLAEEASGSFRLAKVDVDQNPNLAIRYNVRGIPAVKAFQNGQVVSEFVGAQPEPKIREFLTQIAPNPNDLAMSKGSGLLGLGHWLEAEETFSEILSDHPGNPSAILGLVKAQLAQGKVTEVRELLEGFPASREYATAEKLRPLAAALVRLVDTADESEEYLDAAYNRALRLVRMGNIPAAMDGLLDVLREDKNYRKGEVRQVLLGLFEILGDESSMAREYRREMASILF
jgi:putative thioredoxin